MLVVERKNELTLKGAKSSILFPDEMGKCMYCRQCYYCQTGGVLPMVPAQLMEPIALSVGR